MTKLRYNILNLVTLLIFACGTIVFINGLFPINIPESGKGLQINAKSLLNPLHGFKPAQRDKRHKRTIIVLVDALRYDFITNGTMPFTSGSACVKLKLRANAPTVTLPRIKTLMTGTVSNFIDIVHNLGHPEQLDDSLLHRLRERGDIMVFAGDLTWQQLFPSKFHRITANLDSFFVNDFYEGDRNITKILKKELEEPDWNLLITHYLGLDHIGHVEGTSSSKIPEKLIEMDNVIKIINTNKNFQKMFLLLTADHGMRNGGGHGGSSFEEIYVPLYLFKKDCKKKSTITFHYNQIDLAPTLSVLMNVEIPTASIGSLIPEMLEDFKFDEQLYAYYSNTKHLINKAINKFGKFVSQNSAYYSCFNEGKISHRQFLKTKRYKRKETITYFEEAKQNYIRASREISAVLSSSLVNFNYVLIIIGILLTTLITIYTTFCTFFIENKILEYFPSTAKYTLTCLSLAVCIFFCLYFFDYDEARSIETSLLLIILITMCVYLSRNVVKVILISLRQSDQTKNFECPFPGALIFCFFLYIFSQASSSFIEQEHYTWYYLGSTVLLILFLLIYLRRIRLSEGNDTICRTIFNELCKIRLHLLMIVMQTLLKKLNKTGKLKDVLDLADFFNTNENKAWLSLLLILGLMFVLHNVFDRNSLVQMMGFSIGAVCIYCFRGLEGKVFFFSNDRKHMNKVLLHFWLSIIIVLYAQLKILRRNLLETSQTCLLLISCLLHKPHNVIILPMMLFTFKEVFKMCESLGKENFSSQGTSYVLTMKTMLTYFLVKMFYFCQGNSNNFASIDLNPGYIGQSSYNPFVVGTLVTLNTYSAHFNGFLYFVIHIIGKNEQSSCIRDIRSVTTIYIMLSLVPVAMYFWLMVAFRYHLFIYSVFAPKLFYEGFSVIVLFLNFAIINVLY